MARGSGSRFGALKQGNLVREGGHGGRERGYGAGGTALRWCGKEAAVTVGGAAFHGSALGEARKPRAGYPLGRGEVVLHAILRRKTGQSGLHEAIFERQDVGRYEDPLTSAVFERLAYLPIATSWRVLGELLRLPNVPGDPESWLLWPRLRFEDGTVEPDVVIVFADFVLVVEAKHWTGHSTDQWSREVDAVRGVAPRADEPPVRCADEEPEAEGGVGDEERAGLGGDQHAVAVDPRRP